MPGCYVTELNLITKKSNYGPSRFGILSILLGRKEEKQIQQYLNLWLLTLNSHVWPFGTSWKEFYCLYRKKGKPKLLSPHYMSVLWKCWKGLWNMFKKKITKILRNQFKTHLLFILRCCLPAPLQICVVVTSQPGDKVTL